MMRSDSALAVQMFRRRHDIRGKLAMDLKGLGYLISTVSVLFLGAVAWPSPEEPGWKMWALIFGMATSVAGMATRFISHRQDRKDIRRAAHNEPPHH
jgi:hypothetical protein